MKLKDCEVPCRDSFVGLLALDGNAVVAGDRRGQGVTWLGLVVDAVLQKPDGVAVEFIPGLGAAIRLMDISEVVRVQGKELIHIRCG